MSDSILTIQLYRDDLAPLRLDLAPLHAAERRIDDIALATRRTAPELFSSLMRGYIYAAKLHSAMKLQVQKAAIAARRRRSVLMLDVIPVQAKERGLGNARSPTGSEDVRDAFFYADAEYVRIEESRASLEATAELLFGKLMALKTSAEAARAMLDPGAVPHASVMDSVPGPAGADEDPRFYEREHQEAQGFGDPRHD